MKLSPAQIALLVLLSIWIAVAFPAIEEQSSKLSRMRQALGAKSPAERAAFADSPAVPLAREIASGVPAESCVGLLAYAGPAAVDYYQLRLSYLLYPRRVQVAANTTASFDHCEYLAVFRDTDANLAAEPFRGAWDAESLGTRLEGLDRVTQGRLAGLYRQR